MFKMKIDLLRYYKNRLQLACTRAVRIQMEPFPEGEGGGGRDYPLPVNS